MSQPTGGLVLNPSQQIQLLLYPGVGGELPSLQRELLTLLSYLFTLEKNILHYKQMFNINPCKPFVGYIT